MELDAHYRLLLLLDPQGQIAVVKGLPHDLLLILAIPHLEGRRVVHARVVRGGDHWEHINGHLRVVINNVIIIGSCSMSVMILIPTRLLLQRCQGLLLKDERAAVRRLLVTGDLGDVVHRV